MNELSKCSDKGKLLGENINLGNSDDRQHNKRIQQLKENATFKLWDYNLSE